MNVVFVHQENTKNSPVAVYRSNCTCVWSHLHKSCCSHIEKHWAKIMRSKSWNIWWCDPNHETVVPSAYRQTVVSKLKDRRRLQTLVLGNLVFEFDVRLHSCSMTCLGRRGQRMCTWRLRALSQWNANVQLDKLTRIVPSYCEYSRNKGDVSKRIENVWRLHTPATAIEAVFEFDECLDSYAVMCLGRRDQCICAGRKRPPTNNLTNSQASHCIITSPANDALSSLIYVLLKHGGQTGSM